jgi:SIR2-like domain/prokaryotic YEATS domain
MRKSEKFLDISSRNVKAFERLVDVIKDHPLALVGAGMSVGAGYPTWDGLMESFHNTILELPSPPDAPKYIHQLARVTDPLWRAEEYRRLIGKVGYEALIWNTFKPKNGPITQVLQVLVDLDFSHVLTTNYDNSLETAYQSANIPITVLNWTDRQGVGSFLREVSRPGGKRYLVYLHGRFDAPDNVVLTERDYVNRYILGDEAIKKLFTLFMVRPVVLIGFSLTDPELTHLIRSTQGYAQASAPTHFVILPLKASQDEGAIAGWLNGKYGIDPVFYQETPGHEQLLDVLQELCRYKSTQIERKGKEISRTAPIRRRLEHDPDDPQKGRWEGKSERNGRMLSAEVKRTDDSDWFLVKLKVEPSTTRSKPLTGRVTFYLHPTFTPDKVTIYAKDGRAEYEVYSYGAFTVGAVADNGKTKLELDLSTLAEAPPKFKAQ